MFALSMIGVEIRNKFFGGFLDGLDGIGYVIKRTVIGYVLLVVASIIFYANYGTDVLSKIGWVFVIVISIDILLFIAMGIQFKSMSKKLVLGEVMKQFESQDIAHVGLKYTDHYIKKENDLYVLLTTDGNVLFHSKSLKRTINKVYRIVKF